jgi:hypothetical protein
LLFSLVVSFTNLQFSTPQPMRWVGVDNYIALLFNDARFISSQLPRLGSPLGLLQQLRLIAGKSAYL